MGRFIQVAGSHVHQFAEYQDGRVEPIQLWAVSDDGDDGTEVVGLLFHEVTGKIVRADSMSGFKGYHDKRPQ